jgi:LPXTG-motif cell wall-anchored protein
VIYYLEEDGSWSEYAIDEPWISGTEPKKFELPDGEYVLVELDAPEGYETAGPVIFKISGKGTILQVLENGQWVAPAELNTVIMYDPKETEKSDPTPDPGKKETEKTTTPGNPPGTNNPPRITTPPSTPSTTTRRVVTPSGSSTVAPTRATSTGDSNSMTLWIVLAAASAAIAAAAAVFVRRRREDD